MDSIKEMRLRHRWETDGGREKEEERGEERALVARHNLSAQKEQKHLGNYLSLFCPTAGRERLAGGLARGTAG